MEAVRREWSTGEKVAGINRGRLIRVLLLVLNAMLALAIMLEWRGAPRAASAAEVAAMRPQPLQLPSSPLHALALNHYQEVLARPLFWSERRPLQTTSAADQTLPSQPMAFALVGVVVSPQSQHALLSKPGSAEVLTVQPGDIVEGWRIDSMTADSVNLSRGAEHQQISLDEKRTKGH